ncbi:NAD(P)-dependent oxidoreductase [Bacillus paralicheniformis]|uniref:NAD-dependent epimerase/dehydratase family protein n=1 Tax=Bacillus TaxID=1386 RepID=UPI00040D05E1|nr:MULTISPECIES: NAD(P)-dependent oxidoreductase [Bacillus]MCB6215960.1 NAD(P)-dependent oxidoreductase [Bacillus paralicheniformis]MCJ8222099.1 NAD(P)-dependent oxidoreductase [Bacillus paralicheniformis]MCU4669671.1 NAD(P)-dependent oxidoreductase [Bacillus paralicheniformis]MDW6052664.1 NAD(P)-dependent oxidoreductase [Bacillus paralicheniformis]MEC1823960.1 NAD(P)-dependent oxidoreductase [Bacillus paralicheniformis]
MKKVTIIGGNGTVGRVLAGGLAGEGYEVTVLDLKEPDEKPAVRFVRVDAADYNEVVKSIPLNTDAVINLLAVKPTGDLLDRREFEKMTDIFFKATYTILRAAAELGVPKVVFASSNHVTDVYEKNGDSLLGRKINTDDYPQSKSLYGLLKLASENLGYLFSHQSDAKVSVINLRIGTAAENEQETLRAKPRSKKTLLSHPDLVQIFKAAIESVKTYGTYYAVSDNKGRPWSIDSAIRELGFKPKVSTSDILDED